MKYIIFLLMTFVSVTIVNGQLSIKPEIDSDKLPTKQSLGLGTLLSPPVSDDYIPTIYGNLDTIWRHVSHIYDGITYPALYSSSNGGFYLVGGGTSTGGTLSKINEKGEFVWMIDRYYHKDTSVKSYSDFQSISEKSNGDLEIYGGQGINTFYVTNFTPQKTLISPDGIILNEKNTRDQIQTLGSGYFNLPAFTSVIPGEVMFYNGIRSDTTLLMYSMDSELQQKKRDFKVNTGMTEFGSGPDIRPYKDGTFLLAFQGKSEAQPIFHIAMLQYTSDLSFVKRTIIPTNGMSEFVILKDYSIVIASTITSTNSKPLHLRKIDENGNQLWEKIVDGLKDVPLKVNKFYTSKDGGFFVAGEVWLRKADGSVNYDNSSRIGLLAKLNAEGELQWYYTTGRQGYWNRVYAVAEASNGDVVTVCGSNNVQHQTDVETMEIVRLRPKSTNVTEMPTTSNEITVTPNPITNQCVVTSPSNIISLRMLNSLGMEIANPAIATVDKATIDVSNLANGMYFVHIQTELGFTSKAIVVSH